MIRKKKEEKIKNRIEKSYGKNIYNIICKLYTTFSIKKIYFQRAKRKQNSMGMVESGSMDSCLIFPSLTYFMHVWYEHITSWNITDIFASSYEAKNIKKKNKNLNICFNISLGKAMPQVEYSISKFKSTERIFFLIKFVIIVVKAPRLHCMKSCHSAATKWSIVLPFSIAGNILRMLLRVNRDSYLFST